MVSPLNRKLLRDLWRITSHVVRQCLRHGDLLGMHRRVRANPPVIDDPDGEFSALPAPRTA